LTDLGYFDLTAGSPEQAATDFKQALDVLVGDQAPAPFRVFALCRLAEAWQQQAAWGEALDKLEIAVHDARKWASGHFLTAHALARRGWTYVEQSRFQQALENFEEADRVLAAQPSPEQHPEVRIARLHIADGKLLARRCLGNAREAAAQYRKLVIELRSEFDRLRNDAGVESFITESRSQLRVNLALALEHLADCNLLAEPTNRSDLKDASDDLRRAMRVCRTLPEPAATRIKIMTMYKQALALSLNNSDIQDLTLASSYARDAGELYNSPNGDGAKGSDSTLEYLHRLVPAMVELFEVDASGESQKGEQQRTSTLDSKRRCLGTLRTAVSELQAHWQRHRSRENLEYLLFSARILLEEGLDEDRYATIQDTETLLSLCRTVVLGQGEDNRPYLRPYYDSVMKAMLRLKLKHVKGLLEIQWEATQGSVFLHQETKPVLALYVLDKQSYLILDVPHGASKVYCLSDQYSVDEVAGATQTERLALPLEVMKELKKAAGQGATEFACWWRDPLLVTSTHTVTLDPGHFPFRLIDGVTECED
jgi:tetratricopeptide (TPR) repeat protein